jgi:hypothetical protein
MAKPNGAVLYHGPSRIDGACIVCVVTGLRRDSGNRKTRRTAQTWILRADQKPTEAIRSGSDVSICGACIHRGNPKRGQKRTCYVNVGQAPQQVWKAWQRGNYPTWNPTQWDTAPRMIRLGSYGDPAAVPMHVWDAVVPHFSGHLGYTHQWANPKLRDTLKYCQASVDNEEQARCQPDGQGYFRVLPVGSSALLPGEILCPALQGAHCDTCGLCTGQGGARIAIPAHGSTARHYTGERGVK